MKYKVWQHGQNDALEQVVLDTDESYERLMAHAHIHSAEPIVEQSYVKESDTGSVGYTKPSKKIKK
mgnify:CR=1 FL=1